MTFKPSPFMGGDPHAVLPGLGTGIGNLNPTGFVDQLRNKSQTVVIDENTIMINGVAGAGNPMIALGELIYGGAGTPTGYQNRALVSLGASNTALGTINGTPGVNLAIDGDDSTYADTLNSLAVGTWWRVNLGAPFRIGRWRLFQGIGTGFGYATSYRVQSSTDDVTWTDRATITATGIDGDSGYINLAAPITAQFWRIIVDAGSFAGAAWHVHTIAFDLVTTVGAGNVTRLPPPPGRRLFDFDPDNGVPEWAALQAAIATLGAPSAGAPGTYAGVDVAAAGPAQVALLSELNDLRAQVVNLENDNTANRNALNTLLSELRVAGLLAP